MENKPKEILFSCQNLRKIYKNGAVALDGISLELGRGQIVGLLGPNGSGKTTLLKIIAGLLTPTAGELKVVGYAPGEISKAHVSYLPDKEFLPSWMRASDLIKVYSDFYADFDANKAKELLSRLRISDKMSLKTMSKGTKEKVQLSLCMSRQADLYLLDEPIGGVDPAARDYILETILSGYRETSTIIISTHLIADIEKVLDYVLFINQGIIALSTTVDDIRENRGKSVDELFREVYRC